MKRILLALAVVPLFAHGQELITTVAGTGVSGYSGDGAAAVAAQLHQPVGLTKDVLVIYIFVSLAVMLSVK